MNKRKSLFIKIISILMICCMSFVFVGCMGMSPDEKKEAEEEMGDDYDDGEFDDGNGGSGGSGGSGELDFEMYGTKVLYRPEGYDYNAGSGGTAEEQNDYYGKYAWWILNDLYRIYGIVNTHDNEQPYYTRLDFEDSYLPYLYDSIRYQVDAVGTITKQQQQKEDGSWAEPTTLTTTKTLVGANLESKWNWSFNYDLELEGATSAAHVAGITATNKYSTSYSADLYADDTFVTAYQIAYLGTLSQTDYDNYSPYVKALEYAIYSYALDLEPDTITVAYTDDPTQPYTVKAGSVNIDTALDNMVDLFNRAGSYVGLSARQKEKVKLWVRSNVIGYDAKDDFTIYGEIIERVDKDGNFVEYVFNSPTETTLGRNYTETVSNIIDGVCENVPIADPDGDGNGYIDDTFLASEVMEYAGNSFMISGDESFSHEAGASKYFLKPMEYQSVAIMLKDNTLIDGMYIALKYDADGNGTEDGVWDESKYLDIIVELNYFSYEDKKMYTVGSQLARVYDGPFDPYHDNPPDMYEDVGNVYFYDWKACCKDDGLNAHLDEDERLIVGKFNTDIGGGVLKTDVGKANYIGFPLISNQPLVLTGSNPARRYYHLLEPAADESIPEGKTYVTGRFNPEKFMGSDGSDYLEITYKVLKNHSSDTSVNYKFYTGISFIY